jgi:hypothetical protein
MFERFDADGIVLVRNPSFKPWSTAAQPEGYPDVIALSSVPNEDPSELVEAGEADLAFTFRALSLARVRYLATKYPAQLHADPGTRLFVGCEHDGPAVRRSECPSGGQLAVDRRARRAYGGDPGPDHVPGHADLLATSRTARLP